MLLACSLEEERRPNVVPYQVGQEVPGHLALVAGQLGASQTDVRVAGGDPSSRLHDQRDRIAQLQLEKDHQEPEPVPERRGGLQVALPGLEKHREKMDDADQGLEASAATIRIRSKAECRYPKPSTGHLHRKLRPSFLNSPIQRASASVMSRATFSISYFLFCSVTSIESGVSRPVKSMICR
jgi:hypothetical protein